MAKQLYDYWFVHLTSRIRKENRINQMVELWCGMKNWNVRYHMGGILKNRQMHYCFTRRYTALQCSAVGFCSKLLQIFYLLVQTIQAAHHVQFIYPHQKKHKSLINSKRTIFSIHKSASEAILEWIEKTLRCASGKNTNRSTAICEWTSEALRWSDWTIAMILQALHSTILR